MSFFIRGQSNVVFGKIAFAAVVQCGKIPCDGGGCCVCEVERVVLRMKSVCLLTAYCRRGISGESSPNTRCIVEKNDSEIYIVFDKRIRMML